MSKDVHDELIEAFLDYFKWNEIFENKGYYYLRAGVKARKALAKIRQCVYLRRAEILAKQKARKKARKDREDDKDEITKIKQ